MAYRRRFSLNAPKVVTFAVSLALVLLALVSLRIHLPVVHEVVATHRLWLVVSGYALLALGALLPGL